jgi:hypothetical protein
VGLGFALGTRWWSPDLSALLGSRRAATAFALACGVWAVFVMQDGVLVALRRARVVPVENLVFSLLKLGLVVVLADALSTLGIAVSWMAATAVVVVLTNGYLFTRILGDRTTAPSTDVEAVEQAGEPAELRGIARYAGGDYLGTLCWLVCTQLLPVLVLAGSGPAATAVFTMAWTIAYTLYLVPAGMGQSLVAHTCVDVGTLDEARRGVTRRVLVLLVPVVGVLCLAAPAVLHILGAGYAEAGSTTLRLAALSALPNVITSTAVSVARVQRRMSVVVAVLGSLSTLVVGLSLILMPILGITGVGVALLTAQVIVAAGVLVARSERLPRPIVGPFAGLRHAGMLARVAPMALAPLSTDGPRPWRVQGLLPGRSDTAIGLVGPDADSCALLKVANSPSGRLELRRQSTVLAEIHADDRLGEWRELVPRIVSAGEGTGGYYVVESRLTGRDARGALAGDGSRIVASGVATITDLHRRTAYPVAVDEDVLDNWIHRPAARVRAAIPARYRPVLDQLTEALATTLRGRLVAAGWRHGDYTADNILLDEHARVTGVVDWAQAERDGLLVTDVVTLLLATEAQASGQQLGHVVRMWLDAVSPAALRTLTSVQHGLGGDQVDVRALVLLGWLQMVSGNLAKSARYAANPVWMRHNVIAVLRAVAHFGEAASCRVP